MREGFSKHFDSNFKCSLCRIEFQAEGSFQQRNHTRVSQRRFYFDLSKSNDFPSIGDCVFVCCVRSYLEFSCWNNCNFKTNWRKPPQSNWQPGKGVQSCVCFYTFYAFSTVFPVFASIHDQNLITNILIQKKIANWRRKRDTAFQCCGICWGGCRVLYFS